MRHVCYRKIGEAAANWRYDDQYGDLFHDGEFGRWDTKQTIATPNGHRDGVTITVTEVEYDKQRDWLDRPQGAPPKKKTSRSSE